MKSAYAHLLILILAAAPSAWGGALELTPAQAATVKPATTAVQTRAVETKLEFSGALETDRHKTFRVSPFIEGVVVELNAVEHQRVRKGEVLARLRSAALGQTQADYIDAAARHHVAQADRDRLQALWKDGVIAESRWLQAEAEYKSAVAAYDQKRRQLSLTGLSDTQIAAVETGTGRLAEFELASPASGVVLHSEIETGQNLAAGETAFQVVDLSTVWVEVRVPVASLPSIATGAEAGVEVAARPGVRYAGRLQTLAAEVDKDSQTVSGRIVVRNHDGALRPGMHAQVTLAATASRGLAVPASSVFRLGDRPHVFKRVGERRFEPVAVQLGAEAQGWITVSGALAAGDRVVSRGVAELKSHWQYQGGE